ncbi:phosphate ABC transporter permease PstA [Nitrosomonas communis]|uniref:phosphate ABC transporter permease PstA n=1 Tax=Nitrosomonas communis TaxID=44574 RepID=UPI0026ED95AC|nr:phosphate ABC transporter permease PstA [Nitrosomonas communis]MCO6427366.1 phosphate ABC transporter permease PstA [Nitrosomonas communis]
MNELVPPKPKTIDLVNASLAKRRASERLFRGIGLISIMMALMFLFMLFYSIVSKGYTAFRQTHIQLEVNFDQQLLDPAATRHHDVLSSADYSSLVKASLSKLFPDVTSRNEKRQLHGLVSAGAAYQLRDMVMADPALLGQTLQLWVPADDDVDMLIKGHIDRDGPETERRLRDVQIAWLDQLAAQEKLSLKFNMLFFANGDSREPELAGIWGALMGSIYTLLVTLLLSFPMGVATAVYLEEFAPKSKWVDLIEVNINNLAAVPSIIFGLLGLAVFINFMSFPRSAPLVGGLVLAFMTLPTIIIASRGALKSVPPSIREAALGVGASKMQTVYFHVLPLATPGMLTGTIIGMARALGETAPLLMIGMVAFIVDIPSDIFDPATALPVQIYLWADSPERAFVERTSAAIIVLLGFLFVMNALAIILRKKFERRW